MGTNEILRRQGYMNANDARVLPPEVPSEVQWVRTHFIVNSAALHGLAPNLNGSQSTGLAMLAGTFSPYIQWFANSLWSEVQSTGTCCSKLNRLTFERKGVASYKPSIQTLALFQ